MGYDADLAEIYDAVYTSRGKDYAAESRDVAKIIRERHPTADSLLDIACGTGAHIREFVHDFSHVAGLELSPDMIEVAKQKAPRVSLYQGDMRDFQLDGRFDAITCMFSSIGHMLSEQDLFSAVGTMARHATPGGVVIVEPWWFPENFIDGYVASDLITTEGRTFARVSHSSRDGMFTRMVVHHLVADSDSGARHFSEHHSISLYPREVYENAFESSGFRVEYLTGGPSGRGLFVGVLL